MHTCSEYIHVSELNDYLNSLNVESSDAVPNNEETIEEKPPSALRTFNVALDNYRKNTIRRDKADDNRALRIGGKVRKILLCITVAHAF